MSEEINSMRGGLNSINSGKTKKAMLGSKLGLEWCERRANFSALGFNFKHLGATEKRIKYCYNSLYQFHNTS